MLNDKLAEDHLFEKLLFTWLSLLMSLMVTYFVLLLFSIRCLGRDLGLN